MTDASTIRVLLVDDQDLIRAGLATILGSEPGIEVVGQAGDGRTAVAAAYELEPDVVCMDVQMPGFDGLAATRELIAGGSRSAVLVLTTFDRDDYLVDAIAAGASGFLLKTASPEKLIEAVQVLARGDALLAPDVTRRVLTRFAAATPANAVPSDPESGPALTGRERDVLGHVARGRSNAEIASALVVGESTVKTHVSNILSKLGRRDHIQLVICAYEHGMAPTQTKTSG